MTDMKWYDTLRKCRARVSFDTELLLNLNRNLNLFLRIRIGSLEWKHSRGCLVFFISVLFFWLLFLVRILVKLCKMPHQIFMMILNGCPRRNFKRWLEEFVLYWPSARPIIVWNGVECVAECNVATITTRTTASEDQRLLAGKMAPHLGQHGKHVSMEIYDQYADIRCMTCTHNVQSNICTGNEGSRICPGYDNNSPEGRTHFQLCNRNNNTATATNNNGGIIIRL